jgi:hypothetical protein
MEPDEADIASPPSVDQPTPPLDEAAPQPTATRWGLAVGGTLVLAIALVVGLALTGTSSDASAAVSAAAARAVQLQTGHLTMTGTVTADGQTLTIDGTGQFDVSTHASSMDATYSATGAMAAMNGLEMSVVSADGIYYEGGSLIAAGLANAKTWIGLPVSQVVPQASQSSPSTLESPEGIIAVLRQEGSTVTDLGPSSVDGATAERYRVSVSRAQAMARIASSSLPDATKAAATAALATGSLDYIVTIGQDGLLRSVAYATTMSIKGVDLSMHLVEGFDDWGAPVSIITPPADAVCMTTVAASASCFTTEG